MERRTEFAWRLWENKYFTVRSKTALEGGLLIRTLLYFTRTRRPNTLSPSYAKLVCAPRDVTERSFIMRPDRSQRSNDNTGIYRDGTEFGHMYSSKTLWIITEVMDKWWCVFFILSTFVGKQTAATGGLEETPTRELEMIWLDFETHLTKKQFSQLTLRLWLPCCQELMGL